MTMRHVCSGWLLLLGASAVSAQVTPSPSLEIGGADPSSRLHRVRDVTVGNDGSLFVANEGTHEVLVFDASGVFRRAIGRAGDGPGEFQLMSALSLKRDTLWVLDLNRGRVTAFSPDGALISATGIADAVEPGTVALGRMADGALVGVKETVSGGQGYERHGAQLIVTRPGIGSEAIANFRGSESLYQQLGDRVYHRALPYSPRPLGAVRDGRIAFAEGDGAEITILTWPKGEQRTLPVPWKGAPVERAEWLRGLESVGLRRGLPALDPDDVPPRRITPALVGLAFDPQGDLWAMRYPRPGEAATVVRRLTGGVPDSVSVAADMELMEVTNDAIVGLRHDAYGAPMIVVYRRE